LEPYDLWSIPKAMVGAGFTFLAHKISHDIHREAMGPLCKAGRRRSDLLQIKNYTRQSSFIIL